MEWEDSNMATFIPGGGNAWTDFGQGLGKGLQQLAEIKMEQMQQRHKQNQLASAYKQIPGFKPEWAEILSKTPPQEHAALMQLLPQLDALQQQQQQGQQYQEQTPMQNLMGNNQQQRQQQQPYSAQQTQQQQPMNQSQLMARAFETPATKWAREKEETRKQEFQLKQQTATQNNIENKAAKYIEKAATEAADAEQLKANILRAKKLIETGKTRSGLGGLLPLKLTNANEETRVLDKIFNEIILLRGNMGKGVASRMKLQLAQAAKPSLDMPKSAQLHILDDMLEDADKTINAMGIIDEVIEANGGNTPNGLNRIATKVFHQRYSGKNKPAPMQANTKQGQPYNADNEDIVDQGMRLGIGAASRIAPKVITGPGDVLDLGARAIDYGASKFGKDLGVKSAVDKYSPLPTSESVNKRISKWTNGYTDPKGPVEEFGYNIVDLFGSLFAPQAAAGKVAQLIGKAGLTGKTATAAKNIILPFSGYVGSKKRLLAQATVGETAKEVVSGLGGGPAMQTIAQTAGFLAAGSAGTRAKLTKDTEALFKEVKSESKNIDTNVSKAIPKLEAIKKSANANASPYKDEISKIINSSVSAMKEDPKNFSLSNVIGQIQSVNDRFAMSTEQRVAGEVFTPKAIRPYLHDIRKVLDETVKDTARINPEAKEIVDKYLVANDNWRGLNTYGKATQWMKDNAEHFGHGTQQHHWIFNMLRGGTALLGRDIGKVKNLLSSTAGQKAYLQAIDAAAAGNLSRFKSAYDKLIAMAKKENIT